VAGRVIIAPDYDAVDDNTGKTEKQLASMVGAVAGNVYDKVISAALDRSKFDMPNHEYYCTDSLELYREHTQCPATFTVRLECSTASLALGRIYITYSIKLIAPEAPLIPYPPGQQEANNVLNTQTAALVCGLPADIAAFSAKVQKYKPLWEYAGNLVEGAVMRFVSPLLRLMNGLSFLNEILASHPSLSNYVLHVDSDKMGGTDIVTNEHWAAGDVANLGYRVWNHMGIRDWYFVMDAIGTFTPSQNNRFPWFGGSYYNCEYDNLLPGVVPYNITCSLKNVATVAGVPSPCEIIFAVHIRIIDMSIPWAALRETVYEFGNYLTSPYCIWQGQTWECHMFPLAQYPEHL